MITEVGKEEGQWFDPEDVLNFPCESLKVIDGLWISHSGGKFGFSVQKELYLKCGGVPDGKSYKEARDKLYAMNGWSGTIISDYSSPKGHLPWVNAPMGHLPWDVVSSSGELMSPAFAEVLFSRIHTCEL